MAVPFLCDATVVSQDPDNYRLVVSIDQFGGQILFLPVDVLTHGPRDAVRFHGPPLPARGTRGVVAFTRGDARTGRWLGATSPALPDASALHPADGNSDYQAEYAGGWRYIGQDGTRAVVAADGSSFLLGTALPEPTRHVLDANGQRVRSVFTSAQRNPSPPAAMPFSMHLASGASVTVSNTGAVTVTANPAEPLTLIAGSTELVLGPSTAVLTNGSVTVTMSGSTVTVSNGGATQAVRLSGGGASLSLFAS
jgi:hypothetical protein